MGLGKGEVLRNYELNDLLYCSTNTVRVIKSRMRWAEHVARMGERSGVYIVLVGKPEGRRPLGRRRRRWEDNIKMYLQEVAYTCEWGNEPFGFHKMRGISWLAENRLASQEGLWSMEWVFPGSIGWHGGETMHAMLRSCELQNLRSVTSHTLRRRGDLITRRGSGAAIPYQYTTRVQTYEITTKVRLREQIA